MKILQAIILRLFAAAILFAGASLVYYRFSTLYQRAISIAPDNWLLRVGLGLLLISIACFALLPLGLLRTRKRRKITFQSTHGHIVIELDSVERSLKKTMSKLPEVREIELTVLPADNDRKVKIIADVAVVKPPGAGIRNIAADLEEKMAAAAKRLLGVEDIASLDLNISRVIVNTRKEAKEATKKAVGMLEHKTPVVDRLPSGPVDAPIQEPKQPDPQPQQVYNPPPAEPDLPGPPLPERTESYEEDEEALDVRAILTSQDDPEPPDSDIEEDPAPAPKKKRGRFWSP